MVICLLAFCWVGRVFVFVWLLGRVSVLIVLISSFYSFGVIAWMLWLCLF